MAHPEVPFPEGFGALAGDFNGDGFADVAASDVEIGGPGILTRFI